MGDEILVTLNGKKVNSEGLILHYFFIPYSLNSSVFKCWYMLFYQITFNLNCYIAGGKGYAFPQLKKSKISYQLIDKITSIRKLNKIHIFGTWKFSL